MVATRPAPTGWSAGSPGLQIGSIPGGVEESITLCDNGCDNGVDCCRETGGVIGPNVLKDYVGVQGAQQDSRHDLGVDLWSGFAEHWAMWRCQKALISSAWV